MLCWEYAQEYGSIDIIVLEHKMSIYVQFNWK